MEEKPKSFEQAIDQVLADMRATMISKQKDYGPKNILEMGILGVLVRSNDKMVRLKNLYGVADGSFKPKTARNEAIIDTWLDLANYGLIAQMLLKGAFDLPLEDKND